MYQFNKEAFGQKLKTAIKNRYHTQDQFCKVSGIASGTLRSYLDGKVEPGAENLKIIADALNTSVDDLLDNGEEKTSITTPKSITPKDIINAINTLTEAYTYDCIEIVTIEEDCFTGDYPDKKDVNCYAICIRDQVPQHYLYQLKTKGHLKKELASVGEEETYYKLLKKWADIDYKCFIDGQIVDDYDAMFEEVDNDEE